jgi:hypothetical protein
VTEDSNSRSYAVGASLTASDVRIVVGMRTLRAGSSVVLRERVASRRTSGLGVSVGEGWATSVPRGRDEADRNASGERKARPVAGWARVIVARAAAQARGFMRGADA